MTEEAFESLTEEDCMSLLRTAKLGRVAVVTSEGRPEIFPVNFVLHERSVVFVTSSPVLLARAPLGHVAFEADFIDPTTHEGWDVVVTGEGADITDAVDTQSMLARADRIEQWAPVQRDRWITIVNPHFTGRRLYTAAASPTFF